MFQSYATRLTIGLAILALGPTFGIAILTAQPPDPGPGSGAPAATASPASASPGAGPGVNEARTDAVAIIHDLQRAVAYLGLVAKEPPEPHLGVGSGLPSIDPKALRQRQFFLSLARVSAALDTLESAATARNDGYTKALAEADRSIEALQVARALSGIRTDPVLKGVTSLEVSLHLLNEHYSPLRARRRRCGEPTADEMAQLAALEEVAAEAGRALTAVKSTLTAAPIHDRRLAKVLELIAARATRTGAAPRKADAGPGPTPPVPAGPVRDKSPAKPGKALLELLWRLRSLEKVSARWTGVKVYVASVSPKDTEVLARADPVLARLDATLSISRTALKFDPAGELARAATVSMDRRAAVAVPVDDARVAAAKAYVTTVLKDLASSRPADQVEPRKPPVKVDTDRVASAAQKALTSLAKATRDSEAEHRAGGPTPPTTGPSAAASPGASPGSGPTGKVQPLSPRITVQKPFYRTLAAVSKGLETFDRQRAAKDARAPDTLRQLKADVDALMVTRRMAGLNDPRVVKSVRSLETAVTMLATHGGRLYDRKKSQTPLSDQEKQALAALKAKAARLVAAIKEVQAKASRSSRTDRRLARELSVMLEIAESIVERPVRLGRTYDPVDSGVVDLLSATAKVDELEARLRGLRAFFEVTDPRVITVWHDVDEAVVDLGRTSGAAYASLPARPYVQTEYTVSSSVWESTDDSTTVSYDRTGYASDVEVQWYTAAVDTTRDEQWEVEYTRSVQDEGDPSDDEDSLLDEDLAWETQDDDVDVDDDDADDDDASDIGADGDDDTDDGDDDTDDD